MNGTGKFLIITGSFIVLAGIVILFRDSIPFVRHMGKLPGDIIIKKENFSFYFPLTTGIILSILISVLLYLISRFR